VYALFCLLKSKAIALLKQGLDVADAKITLQQLVKPPRRKRLQRRPQRRTTERPANNYLLSKDIYPQPVSFTTRTKRIHGLAAEKATLYPARIACRLCCNVTKPQIYVYATIARSQRIRTITWCFPNGNFLPGTNCFYKAFTISLTKPETRYRGISL
jgi:hypothetical protein